MERIDQIVVRGDQQYELVGIPGGAVAQAGRGGGHGIVALSGVNAAHPVRPMAVMQ